MSGRLFGYARLSVASDADANNLENQRRVLADCEQVFEDVGSGASWNRPGLNRLKAALQQGDCGKVAALDRLSRNDPGPHQALGHWTPAEVFYGAMNATEEESKAREGPTELMIVSLAGTAGISLNSTSILS